MDVIQTSNKAVDLFGSGLHGFSAGNPGGGVLATLLSAAFSNHVMMELVNPVLASGQALDANNRAQLLEAIRRIAGRHVTTVTSGTTALTAAHAGLIMVDASGGNVTINLPAANLLAGLEYRFTRVDTSGNSVTINRAGSDTIDGNTSRTLGVYQGLVIEANGAAMWAEPQRSQVARSANGWVRLPSGILVQWGQYSAGSGTDVTNTWTVSFPTACFAVIAMHIGTDTAVNVVVNTTYTASQFPLRSNFGGGGSVSAFVIGIGH